MRSSCILLEVALFAHPYRSNSDVACRYLSVLRLRLALRNGTAGVPRIPSRNFLSISERKGPSSKQSDRAIHSLSARPLSAILFYRFNPLLRLAHTDVRFPSFDEYRRESTLDAAKAARQTENQRRVLPHLIYYGVGGIMALLAVKQSTQAMVAFKGMARDQMALANTVVQLDEIPEGEMKTYEWRGKPVFVKHRTDDEIKREKAVDLSKLRHPQRDDERVQRDQWLVLLGICTHLGCVPIPNSDEFPGGYKCPCHGAYFDASGRIRKGPAPLNLRVPPYNFQGDTIVIGSKGTSEM